MKNFLLPIIAICALLFTSCDAESTGGVSSVTFYPNMTLKGDAIIVLNEGETYTDAGANSEAGGASLTVKTEGTVDNNKPGVYKLKYSSTNEDGFNASLTRTVIILSKSPSNIDLSGVFTRSGNVNNITRISDREYFTDNATGYTAGNENNIRLTFYNIDDKQIYAPYQENASATGISAESSNGIITDANNWKWSIIASSFFGAADRVFKR